jgi:hypothetical protein
MVASQASSSYLLRRYYPGGTAWRRKSPTSTTRPPLAITRLSPDPISPGSIDPGGGREHNRQPLPTMPTPGRLTRNHGLSVERNRQSLPAVDALLGHLTQQVTTLKMHGRA